jgi:hypothetical protein
MSNSDGAGAAQAKTGDNKKAIDRAAGRSATATAMDSKTRSGHPATQENNLWKDTPFGWGDGNNIRD